MSLSWISQVTGTGATTFKDTLTWSPNAQIEQDYYIKDTDGSKSISLTLVDDPVLLIIKSDDGEFSISMTISGATVSMYTDYLALTMNSTLTTNLTALSISTASTTDVLISVKLFGEASSS